MNVENRPLIKSGRLLPLVFALTLSFGFSLWHRTQVSIEALDGRFTGNDAYLYFRQMERIVEEGKLPKRDMERWLPLGRDLSLSHNLYPYAVAYSYRTARVFIPGLTLYEFSCYAPAVLFALTSALFTAVLWTCFGWEIAGLGTLFFIMTPAAASRTSFGFADRDAFCLFLGVLAGSLYLWKIRTITPVRRLLLSAFIGIVSALGAFAWQGFGVFSLCLLVLWIWQVVWPERAEEAKSSFIEFAVFCACLTLPLLMFSDQHRFWIRALEPTFPAGWLAVFPVLCAFSALLICQAFRSKKKLLKWASFTPAALLVWFATVWVWESGELPLFAEPFRGRLMETITELRSLNEAGWRNTLGAMPLFALVGVAGSWVSVFRKRLSRIAFETCLFGTAWVAIWGYLMYGSMRYAIMFAPAAAAWTAVSLCSAGEAVCRRIEQAHSEDRWLLFEGGKAFFTAFLPIMILFWTQAGTFALRGARHAIGRPAKPSLIMYEAFRWMSQNLDRSSGMPVVAARWEIGTMISVLADVATIEGNDTWKHYWVHLSSRHLFCAESEVEALRFLKTREADYWLLTRHDLYFAQQIVRIGSATVRDRNMDFSRRMWDENGSEAFELVFENPSAKLFRIHYPADLNVPQALQEAWTAPDFPDLELRRVWMSGKPLPPTTENP